MIDTWFADLLTAKAAELSDHKGRGGITALSRLLELPRESVDRWASGQSSPDVVTAGRVIEKLGGNIVRALPTWDWERDSPYDGPSMTVMGQVQAGGVEFAGESVYTVSGISQEFWLGKRGHGDRPVILLEVHGDSMAPDYRSGDLIACRKPGNISDISDGTPCVFLEANHYTFKVLRRTRDKRIVGCPINQSHKPIVFDKLEDSRVEYVVVGKIERVRKRR